MFRNLPHEFKDIASNATQVEISSNELILTYQQKFEGDYRRLHSQGDLSIGTSRTLGQRKERKRSANPIFLI